MGNRWNQHRIASRCPIAPLKKQFVKVGSKYQYTKFLKILIYSIHYKFKKIGGENMSENMQAGPPVFEINNNPVRGEWNGVGFSITRGETGWVLKPDKLVTADDFFTFLNEYVHKPGNQPTFVVKGLDRDHRQSALGGKAGLVRFNSDEELSRIKEATAQGRGSVEDITGPAFSYGGYNQETGK